ncbi:MAG: hypothetical protein ACTSYL_12945 [Candidatus Thorarchaeota archaeon]
MLIAIQEKPFGTIEELANRAKISKPTAAKRLRILQGAGGGKKYFTVSPLLNYYNMGLESVDVLLETNNLEDMKIIEQVAYHHPYTAYRCRTYGAVNGVFLQFRTPHRSNPKIKELIRILKREGIIKKYKFLATTQEPTIYTSLRIDGWNPDTLSWDFDWNKWFKLTVKPPRLEKRTGEMSSALKWLTRRDLNIIHELMMGARRKNIKIIKALAASGIKFTPQTFSRRYRMIREECIEGHRVTFDPEVFDIYSNVVIFGKGDESNLTTLRSRLETKPIPFESTMRTVKENLFWFVRLQPTQLSPLLANLYSHLDEMSVCLVDYTNSMRYYLWPETFDEESRKWRTDRKFMVDDVIEAALKK